MSKDEYKSECIRLKTNLAEIRHALGCPGARQEATLERIIFLKDFVTAVNESDCGSNSCMFAKHKGGMRTNGPCRCMEKHPICLAARRLAMAVRK